MAYDSSDVPTDPTVLQELVIDQSKTIDELQNSNRQLSAKLDKAITELQRLTRLFEKFFNKSSEKLLKDKAEKKKSSPSSDETDSTDTPKGKRGEKGGGGRNPLPADLPRVERIVDVPETERTCPECGTPFKRIGGERSESLHFKPMELYVVVLVLVKYMAACDCCAKRSAKAESPIKAIDKGVASNSLVAAISVQKYADHLPLARQSKRLFKRCGVDLPESSMCRWMAAGAELGMPLYLLMKKLLFGGVYVQMDATGAPYLDPAVKGKSCKGTLWGYNGDPTVPYVLYDFQVNGTRAGPAAFLKGYDQFVQCDASTVNRGLFVASADSPAPLTATEVGCWSHARRNFFDAKDLQPASKEVLEMIGELYGVERRAKKWTPWERLALRQEKSVPVLDRIFGWCRDNQAKYDLPTDLLGKAIGYLLNQESTLWIYCTDGRLEIDNNGCERILRLPVIGRKNWMFYGSEAGGRTGAIWHSFAGSAIRNGLNEYEYILDVLDCLSDLPSQAEMFQLLPDRWKPRNSR